jgi:hypothetical protein
MIARSIWCLVTFAALVAPCPSMGLAQTTSSFYVSDLDRGLWTLNTSNGTLTSVGTTSVVMADIAGSPSGALFGIGTNGGLYQINPSNAAATLIGQTGVTLPSALEFRQDGTLFLANAPAANTGNLYTVNPATGAATLVGGIGFQPNGDLAFDPSGRLLLTATNFTTEFNLVEVNPVTGAGTLIGPHGHGSMPAMDLYDGRLLGLNTQSQLIEFDLVSGAGTLLFITTPTISPTGAAVVPVPEPGAVLGIAGVAWAGWVAVRGLRAGGPPGRRTRRCT